MGLDQFMQAKHYAYLSEYHATDEAPVLAEAATALGIPADLRSGGYELTVDVGSWRKANAIHKWFVDHCADGKDDCSPVYVEREKVAELRDLCAKLLVRKNVGQARKLLPPTSGFFFGSTDVDQYYWDDLERTVALLDKALKLDEKKFELFYRASW